jgi:hypothetical protein
MGYETLRPSNRSTVSSSLVTFTALILWCEKLIPLCAQFGVVLLNDMPDGSLLRTAETRRMIPTDTHQPQLTRRIAHVHVDMGRLRTFIGVEAVPYLDTLL